MRDVTHFYVSVLIHMCDMTHPYMCHDVFLLDMPQSYVRHDSFLCVDTHSYVWQDPSICVTWIIHFFDMTHNITQSYVWHVPSICVPWRIPAWHALFRCVTWPISMCRDSFILQTEEIALEIITTAKISNKFSRKSPSILNNCSRESPKFQTSFHGNSWCPRHSKDLSGKLIDLDIQIF